MFVHRLLSPDDDVTGFDCGVASLDTWLHANAARSHQQGVARVHVWVDESEPQRVVAYTAIQPTQLASRHLSRGQAGGHTAVPGYLIARLALDRELHGSGLGAELLIRALEVCVDASMIGGGRIIAVDPIDDAAATFYTKFGFTPTKGPGDRLVMKMSTAAAAVGRSTASGTT